MSKYTKHSELWPEEFNDLDLVLRMGAEKYRAHDWERIDCDTFNNLKRCDNTFHHLSRLFNSLENDTSAFDDESNLHHALHAAANLMMIYTRYKRGIK